ncbi:MAG: zf-HC2 domain-containing protein [Acutalibacteraceae bacterium]|nr:zf-HC2 domain-containing protein [Acutalibacteraceae bacterium]
MNNKKTEIDCDIVRDLLPLYHDGVVSDTTKLAVEEHMDSCTSCKQEYDELLVDLPVEYSESNTKNKFKTMMSKQKIKRISILITSVILSCVLVVSIIIGLTEIPIAEIPEEEIEIYKVYGYESEYGYEFFVLFNASSYEKSLFGLGEIKDGVLSLEFKKPIISDMVDSEEVIWAFKIQDEYIEELESLSFAGDIIWSKKDLNKNIPDYVYEYISNEDKWVDMDLDLSEDYIRISYEDGSYKQWTIDGELVEQLN